MKDVLFYLLVYKIWNTEFHSQHEVLIAVVLTLWIVMHVYEVISALRER
jgi:hypothetical protein